MISIFDVKGMSCASCSAHVDKAVRCLPGVKEVSVNLLSNSMTVDYDDSIISAEDINNAVKRSGYSSSLRSDSKTISSGNNLASELDASRKRLLFSGLLLLLLMYIGMGHMVGLSSPKFASIDTSPLGYAVTMMLLSLSIILINFRFYRSGFSKLLRLAPNMDSLVSMGSFVSFVYSVYLTACIGLDISRGNFEAACKTANGLYYESAAMILVFISVGKLLEARSKLKTRSSIDSLLSLRPQTAQRINGEETEIISLEDIRPGDILLVKAGDKIPADGIITKGSGSIDESMLTGENLPLEKSEGDEVFQACINKSGYFEFRVTKNNSDTAFAEIIRLVEQAANSKAPVSRLADRISAVFVPVVFALSLVTLVIWLACGADFSLALKFAINVIVISCPCSLGLATPTAITAGTGKGAKLGILFKSAEVLENLSSVDTVVFDKTGTITSGILSCSDIWISEITDLQSFLSLAGSAEKLSSHPIGSAIYDYCLDNCNKPFPPATDYKEIEGSGIKCLIDGAELICGNFEFIRKYVDINNSLSSSYMQKGITPIFFAYNSKLIGIIGVNDTVREDSIAAVEYLHRMKLNTALLTGDCAAAAKSVASKTNISNLVYEVKPGQKSDYLKSLHDNGSKTVMVGDGINDAPALTTADIGIAIGAGTDVAIDSADIILTANTPADVVNAIDLSRKVMRNIRQNLFWAFFYNCLGIPIAAGVFYKSFGLQLNPMIASALMSCSSLFVVTNALRLNLYKPLLKGTSTLHKNKTGIEVKNVSENVGYEIAEIEDSEEIEKLEEPEKMEETTKMKVTVFVEGMMCVHCQAHVAKAFNDVDGISAVVDLESKTATLELSRDFTDEELIKIVTDAGYEVSKIVPIQ